MIPATVLSLYAAYQSWIDSLLSQCTHNSDGTVTIPADLVARLRFYTVTDYAYIPDEEKVGILEHAKEIERSATH